MCDTLIIRENGATWFAKNSDREPDEPQAMFFRDRVTGDKSRSVRTTHIEIPQTATRHATLLSQPVWLWGAEIGINEHGVAIGNEAVFSRMIDRQGSALLGMDLLRLGLERGANAREALDVITRLLEQFGQGGPAGYHDAKFRYDNAFIIADAKEAWVLETAGRLWVAKRVERWAISNCYSIGSDYDLASADLPEAARRLGTWNGRGDFSFSRAFDTRTYAFIGGAHRRRALNTCALASGLKAGWTTLAARLRDHGRRDDHFASHDNRQICLHSGGLLRPSQTTASIVARLAPGSFEVAATGTSAPCLSLFQRMSFGDGDTGGLVMAPGARVADTRWASFEPVHHRALFDVDFRAALNKDRDELEIPWLGADAAPDPKQSARQASEWHARWRATAVVQSPRYKGRYGRWWARLAKQEVADLEKCFTS